MSEHLGHGDDHQPQGCEEDEGGEPRRELDRGGPTDLGDPEAGEDPLRGGGTHRVHEVADLGVRLNDRTSPASMRVSRI